MVFAFVGAIPWFLQNNSCLSSPTVSLRPYMQFCATDFNLRVGTPWLFILHLFWQVAGSFVSIQLLQKDVSLMWCKSENFWLIKQMKMMMAAPMGHWYTCSFVSEGCAPKVLWILYLSKYPKDEFFWNFSPEFTETFFPDIHALSLLVINTVTISWDGNENVREERALCGITKIKDTCKSIREIYQLVS